MKKKFLAVVAAVVAAVATFAFTGCKSANAEKNILVVTREDGSGTREAFDKYVGVTADNIKAGETMSNTAAMKLKVASVESAIGYISLTSVDNTVKALTVDGVAPTADNVRSGDYKIARPFLMLTKTGVQLSAAAQDFYNYCMSSNVKKTIEADGITTADFDTRAAYTAPETALSGEVTIKGSSSMKKLMTTLVEDYKTLCGSKVANVTFVQSYPSSADGRTAVKDSTNTGSVIGVASSSKADAGYEEHTLCLDAVAIIVNKKNDKISNVTAKVLLDIYTGKTVKFSAIKG